MAPSERAPDPRRRNEGSHRAVLEATVELLEQVGYRNLTVEGVARRAGVGKQTIYRWWGGSKADLVLEAFGGVGGERVVPIDSGSVRDDLRSILEPVFALHGDLDAGAALANRTLMAEAQLDPAFHDRYLELHRGWWGPMLDAVRRGIDRGELREDLEPQLVVDTLLGMSWYRLLLGHRPLDDAAATDVIDLVLDGGRS